MYILHALGRASPYGHQRAGLGGRQPGKEVIGGSYGCEAHGRGLPPDPVKGGAPDCQIAAIIVSCQTARLDRVSEAFFGDIPQGSHH